MDDRAELDRLLNQMLESLARDQGGAITFKAKDLDAIGDARPAISYNARKGTVTIKAGTNDADDD